MTIEVHSDAYEKVCASLTEAAGTLSKNRSALADAVPGTAFGLLGATNDGFVIAADQGHPEYPGEVAFRVRNVDGHATFEVSGAYDSTILNKLGFSGATNSAYSGISDVSIWADMQYRLKDAINYGF
jgi:hypothetical protein